MNEVPVAACYIHVPGVKCQLRNMVSGLLAGFIWYRAALTSSEILCNIIVGYAVNGAFDTLVVE